MAKGFSTAVKVAARKRATDMNGEVHCDGCGAIVKKWRIDHVIGRGMGGRDTLDNAQVLGWCCWAEKDAADGRVAKRLAETEARHLGVGRPKQQIRSRGFEKSEKVSRVGPTSKTVPHPGFVRGSR